MKYKEIEVKCFFGINRDNNNNESVFEITDAISRKKIAEVTFTPLQLTKLLGRMGHVSGQAKVLDIEDYQWVGKTPVRETITVQLPKNVKYEDRKKYLLKNAKEIIINKKDKPIEHYEIDVNCSSKGDVFTTNGVTFAKVKLKSYE